MQDTFTIIVKAGKGGDGLVSFRREKFIQKGGPDGGDGGKGGDIIIKANSSLRTLDCLKGKKEFKAQDGRPGGASNKTGKDAPNLIIDVPVGTQLISHGELICDLLQTGQKYLLARGGKGGWGNKRFATSTNQTPKYAKKGYFGEKKIIELNLKYIADVGLVGLPNAGKSSFLARISKAKPKVADYPFTTIEPNLGVTTHKGKTFIVADIPGLIEGAQKGKGLGYRFLRHIERTKIILHLIDSTSPNISKDFKTIKTVLKQYNPALAKKPTIVALNKLDLIKKPLNFQQGISLSCLTGKGVEQVLDQIIYKLDRLGKMERPTHKKK